MQPTGDQDRVLENATNLSNDGGTISTESWQWTEEYGVFMKRRISKNGWHKAEYDEDKLYRQN